MRQSLLGDSPSPLTNDTFGPGDFGRLWLHQRGIPAYQGHHSYLGRRQAFAQSMPGSGGGKGEDRAVGAVRAGKRYRTRAQLCVALRVGETHLGKEQDARGRRNGLGGSGPSCACRRTQPRGFRSRRGITPLPYEMHTSTSLPEPRAHRERFRWNGCPSTFLVFEINPFIPLPTTVFAPLDVRRSLAWMPFGDLLIHGFFHSVGLY